MLRSAEDLEMPKDRASCRIVRFVRRYAVTTAVTSSALSARGRFHGPPRRVTPRPGTGGPGYRPGHRS
ncbi:hypothetical protein DWB77_00227 [Streptomyces hundungensis]|uniref:Uncharacterized protein n=1 Tax=Streptomyces hundungensis TaxID=1077946 RepID=A0A387HAY1_9ACTN|nr:hypothetical protein DWB77_00227 [Streptomyces hundungensis]